VLVFMGERRSGLVRVFKLVDFAPHGEFWGIGLISMFSTPFPAGLREFPILPFPISRLSENE
jgi:hypothetical protein